VPPASQESAASPVRVSVSTVVVTSATARPVTRSAATAPALAGLPVARGHDAASWPPLPQLTRRLLATGRQVMIADHAG
jgi:hypothetical protein